MKTEKFSFITPLINITILLFFVALVGCGSGGSFTPVGDDTSNPSTALTPAEDLGALSLNERLFYTDAYAGWLVIHTQEALKLRMDANGELYSNVSASTNEVAAHINSIISHYPGAALERSVSASEAQVDFRRAELEQLSQKKLADFNAIYHVKIEDPNEAVRMLRDLEDVTEIVNVYPSQKLQLMNLNTTPDLTAHQGYLSDMNVTAAWNNYGVTGQGVTIVDAEGGWNANHLDLPISDPSANLGGEPCLVGDPNPDCNLYIPHGTAVVGILGALDNGHGITGIAHGSTIKFAMAASAGVYEVITDLTDGNELNGEVAPGDVIVVPGGFAGALNQGGTCASAVGGYGCLPADVVQQMYDAVETASAAGVIVVEGAGNGSVSLDDPTVYYSHQVNLSNENANNRIFSIIVGASQGSNHQKTSWSTCGGPVSTYAWGQNVATTSYQTGVYDWLGTIAPLPPNTDPDAFFIDNFGGTSAATPMVAAAAALIQSYAKQIMGDTRFIMPWKIREILYSTGLPQSGGGCNIGRQPNLTQALAMVDQLWADWSAAYPVLATNNGILAQNDLTHLRNDAADGGLGLVCNESNPANSDPVCPDDSMWPSGVRIAKKLDFDGDGRADLVAWKAGQLKIDLSGAGGEADGFGNWDVVVNYSPIQSDIVWPYVEDMNSDGRADLVLYDKTNGTWYISYTRSIMLGSSTFPGWDHVITTNVQDQLEMDPWQTMYCRPHPGDYNGDGWVDLAVACSDGVWYIADRDADSNGVLDYDWPANGSITYDDMVTYLTPQQLSEAPGWAYLTSTTDASPSVSGTSDLIVKVPDGLTEEGRMVVWAGPDFVTDSFSQLPHLFGGNDQIAFLGMFTQNDGWASIGVKGADGSWLVADPTGYNTLNSPFPASAYGGLACHPVVADFDGDGVDDRTVMCPDGWKIAYASSAYLNLLEPDGTRTVDMGYDTSEFTLPGRAYAGGITYDKVQSLLSYLMELDPNNPPQIPVDMISLGTCQLDGTGGCY